jgi:class 3 adenylate cyclase
MTTEIEPPSTDLPEGTVTFLFTDIEGSTQLLSQLRYPSCVWWYSKL